MFFWITKQRTTKNQKQKKSKEVDEEKVEETIKEFWKIEKKRFEGSRKEEVKKRRCVVEGSRRRTYDDCVVKRGNLERHQALPSKSGAFWLLLHPWGLLVRKHFLMCVFVRVCVLVFFTCVCVFVCVLVFLYVCVFVCVWIFFCFDLFFCVFVRKCVFFFFYWKGIFMPKFFHFKQPPQTTKQPPLMKTCVHSIPPLSHFQAIKTPNHSLNSVKSLSDSEVL